MTQRTVTPTGADAIVVRPATIERFDDIGAVINRVCWCQWWRITAGEYERSSSSSSSIRQENWDRRRVALLAQCAAEPTPGILAYLGERPVGWRGFGPRTVMARLEHSRTIPKLDDLPVWSIVCFSVRPGHRRRGVATALLCGVIDHARGQGAIGLEAHATDPAPARAATRSPRTRASPACSRRRASGEWSRQPAASITCRAG